MASDSTLQFNGPAIAAGAANPRRSLKFPAHFLWGAATAPTQIEGHVQNEWTDFVARDGSNCRIACDSYHRYPEDIEWLKKLGVKAYRFGIEWSRLQPAPFAPLNQKELERYCDQLDRLRDAGILPMVVLHHFSNPPWISATGGWLNSSTPEKFVDYVMKLSAALKSRVRVWNTFNEPDTYASCTYLLGEFPPFYKRRPLAFRRVILNMARAHLEICRLIRQQGSGAGPVEIGFTKNWTSFKSFYAASPWDAAIAVASHYLFNRFVLSAFMGGRRREAPTFLGLNYYGRVRLRHCRALAPVGGFTREHLAGIGVICDDMFERHPPGMELTLLDLHRRHRLPIYLTEHGSASTDEDFRADDLKQNLAALHRALELGVDVRGFFYWSLMDNFEWQYGYAKKFGLVEVDFQNEKLPRKMKPLGDVYRKVCAENVLPL